MQINPEQLKRERLRRAWTQQHLADAAGLSLRTVQRVERDGTAGLDTQMSLAAALDVTPEELRKPSEPQPRWALGPAAMIAIAFTCLVLGAGIGAGMALSLQ